MGKKVIASGGDNGPNTIYKVRIYTNLIWMASWIAFKALLTRCPVLQATYRCAAFL